MSCPRSHTTPHCIVDQCELGLEVASGNDALEFIMAGASAVQVGTANMIDPEAVLNVVDGIEDFCIRNKISDLNEIRGFIKEDG